LSELIELTAFFLLKRRKYDEYEEYHITKDDDSLAPMFVSLHVPVCREPVEVVIATLRSMAQLKYQNYEVLVVYNNTADERLWRPIQELCTTLGPKFRFFFVRELDGYKAGALNYALARTDHRAEIIGVVDSDYVLSPDYLSSLTRFFRRDSVGFVQVPQNYRFISHDFFSRGCYWEYWQFFEIGMVLRAERNAAMLHGTMCLIKKKALISVGGWAEWCLTEDSELGLRILCAGYQGVYMKESYGFGLLPFKFIDYKRQRWRWVIGGAQQLRMYVLGERKILWRQLRIEQRMYILQSWAPWFRDSLIVISFSFLMMFVVLVKYVPEVTQSVGILGATILFVFLQHVVRQLLVSLVQLRLSAWDTLYAFLAIFSLTITVGLAVIFGLLGYKQRFIITPKEVGAQSKYFRSVSVEMFLFFLVLAACFIVFNHASDLMFGIGFVPILYLYCTLPAFVMGVRS